MRARAFVAIPAGNHNVDVVGSGAGGKSATQTRLRGAPAPVWALVNSIRPEVFLCPVFLCHEQMGPSAATPLTLNSAATLSSLSCDDVCWRMWVCGAHCRGSVSYTHLTLPTKA